MVPPLVLDIDGTLTRANSRRSPAPIDPRVFGRVREWEAPVMLATGKAVPFPVALCQFIGIPVNVVAETGGVVCTDDRFEVLIDTDAPAAVSANMRERTEEHSPGLMNRWRETEVAFRREVSLETLQTVASTHGLEIVDTGYAYHVKDPSVSKGRGLELLLDWLDLEGSECVAIGDSVNDVSVFRRVGRGIAVANAHAELRAIADQVTAEGHADGVLAALAAID